MKFFFFFSLGKIARVTRASYRYKRGENKQVCEENSRERSAAALNAIKRRLNLLRVPAYSRLRGVGFISRRISPQFISPRAHKSHQLYRFALGRRGGSDRSEKIMSPTPTRYSRSVRGECKLSASTYARIRPPDPHILTRRAYPRILGDGPARRPER